MFGKPAYHSATSCLEQGVTLGVLYSLSHSLTGYEIEANMNLNFACQRMPIRSIANTMISYPC